MTINYQLRIDNLHTREDGTVEKIQWLLIADDGQNQAVRSAEAELDPPGSNSTPFDQLTELQVKGWISTKYAAEIGDLKTDLAKELRKYAKELQHSKPPWIPERRSRLRHVVGERDRRNKPTPVTPATPRNPR